MCQTSPIRAVALAFALALVAGCGKANDRDKANDDVAETGRAASGEQPGPAPSPVPEPAAATSPELAWIDLPPQRVVGWLQGPAPKPFMYELTVVQGFVQAARNPRKLDDDSKPPYYTNSELLMLRDGDVATLRVSVEVEEATLQANAERGSRSPDSPDHVRKIIRQEATPDGWIIVWDQTSRYFKESGGVDVEIARHFGAADSGLVISCVAVLHSETAFANKDTFERFFVKMCDSLKVVPGGA